MSSPLEILNRLYPNARVTSTRRDPNSRLGRANPRSYHNIGQAFDIAPIPGVKFNDYVSSLKGNGVNVIEALDEASKPLPHTTGPNWHIAYGDAQVAPKKKPATLAALAQSRFPVVNGMDPLAPNPEPYYSPVAAAPAPTTLADLGKSQFPVAANGKDPLAAKPSAFGKGGDGWKILGVLADSYLQANGQQGNYIPQLLKSRQMEAEAEQRREEFGARLDLMRQKALMGPQPSQTERLMQRILDPNTPAQEKALIRSVLMRPLIATVNGSDGSQYQQPYYPDEAGGEDDWEYSN